AADEILRLGEGTVRDGFLLATDDLAGPLERLAAVLQVALSVECLKPLHPPLHVLLRAFGRSHRFLPRGVAHSVEIKELAHVTSSLFIYMTDDEADSGQEIIGGRRETSLCRRPSRSSRA